jgi:hypothetical protein
MKTKLLAVLVLAVAALLGSVVPGYTQTQKVTPLPGDVAKRTLPPAPTLFSCPPNVNASAPGGWTAVPPGMKIPVYWLMLVKPDGTWWRATPDLDKTKFINCFYGGNASTGNPPLGTQSIFMTLPGDANACWSCVKNGTQAKCTPNGSCFP